MTIPGCADAL